MNPNFKNILIILLALSPIILSGQSQIRKNVSIGIGAGLSWNDVFNHTNDGEFDMKFSPVLLTVHAQKQLSEKWYLLSELDYIHKGPEDYVIDYLVLSVLPKYTLFPNANISILGGPYIGYLFEYRDSGRVTETNALKDYDLGFDAGVSFSKKIGKKAEFFVSPRVEVGLIRFSYSNHLSLQLKTGLRFG